MRVAQRTDVPIRGAVFGVGTDESLLLHVGAVLLEEHLRGPSCAGEQAGLGVFELVVGRGEEIDGRRWDAFVLVVDGRILVGDVRIGGR